MNINEKRISKYTEPNGLNGLYDAGYSPFEVKISVVSEIQYMFDNIDLRNEDLQADFLTVFHIHASALSNIEGHKFICLGLLEIYRSAFNKNSLGVVEAISYWYNDILKGLSKHWTLVYAAKDEEDSADYDRFESTMQTIGQMIEGIMLPQLKLLLTLSRIKRSKPINYENISSLKLGNIVQELIDTENGYLKGRLIETITNNTVSAIRNICYHHNYGFDGELYYLTKIDKAGETRYDVTIKDVLDIRRFIAITNSFLRVVEISFIQDNHQYIHKYLPDDHYEKLYVRALVSGYKSNRFNWLEKLLSSFLFPLSLSI